MKAYIAGPMSGLLHFNYEEFTVAAWGLRRQGFEVLSPAEIHTDTTQPRAYYMRADIDAVLECDMVFALPDWHKSRGARLEVDLAEQTGRPVFLITDNTLAAWREEIPQALATSFVPQRCSCVACLAPGGAKP